MSEVVSQPNRVVRYSAIAGIVGPVLYTITWLVLGFLEPIYSHTRDPISNLSAIGASFALVMTIVIFIFAILIVVFAYGLQRGLPPGFWGGSGGIGSRWSWVYGHRACSAQPRRPGRPERPAYDFGYCDRLRHDARACSHISKA